MSERKHRVAEGLGHHLHDLSNLSRAVMIAMILVLIMTLCKYLSQGMTCDHVFDKHEVANLTNIQIFSCNIIRRTKPLEHFRARTINGFCQYLSHLTFTHVTSLFPDR